MNIKGITYRIVVAILVTSFYVQQNYAGAQGKEQNTTSQQSKLIEGEVGAQCKTLEGTASILQILAEFFNITSLGSTSSSATTNAAIASMFSNAGKVFQKVRVVSIMTKGDVFSIASTSIIYLLVFGYFGLKDIKKLKNAKVLADFYKKNPRVQKEIQNKKSTFMLMLGLGSILELSGTISLISTYKKQKTVSLNKEDIPQLPSLACLIGLLLKYGAIYKRYRAEDKILSKAIASSAGTVEDTEEDDDSDDE